jgi:hypothetical protein
VIVDSLSGDDVAVAVGPNTIAAVLALLKGVQSAAFATSVFTGPFIQGEKRSFFDLGYGFHTGLDVDASNRCRGQRSNKSGKENETHIGSVGSFVL